MSDIERTAGVIVSPAKTFEDINRSPTWLFPVLLLLIFNFAVAFVVYRIMVNDSNFEQIALTKIQWDSKSANRAPSMAEIQQQIEKLRRERRLWYLLPLISVPSTLIPLTLFFYVLLMLARAGASLFKVFVAIVWSFILYRCVGGIVTIAALLIRGPAKFFPGAPESWSPTSLAQLVSHASVSPNVYAAISKIDVFLIWWLVVMAIGFSKVSKQLSIRRSAALVTIAEVAYLLLNAAGFLPGRI